MSKIKNVFIDFMNQEEINKYIENLEGQINTLEVIVKEKGNLIKELNEDYKEQVRLNELDKERIIKILYKTINDIQ